MDYPIIQFLLCGEIFISQKEKDTLKKSFLTFLFMLSPLFTYNPEKFFQRQEQHYFRDAHHILPPTKWPIPIVSFFSQLFMHPVIIYFGLILSSYFSLKKIPTQDQADFLDICQTTPVEIYTATFPEPVFIVMCRHLQTYCQTELYKVQIV